MNDTHETLPAACSAARNTVQEQLDGPVDAVAVGELERHLGGCSDCREYRRDLVRLQRSLRELPRIAFPDETLEQVWDHTTRAGEQRSAPPVRVAGGVWLAAAAVLVITAVLVVWNNLNAPDQAPGGIVHPGVADTGNYSPEEIEQAALEAQQVLALTAQALQRGRNAAGRVLAEEVSPALQRIPIRWGAAGGTDRDRGRS